MSTTQLITFGMSVQLEGECYPTMTDEEVEAKLAQLEEFQLDANDEEEDYPY
jgi:hypothetical protein